MPKRVSVSVPTPGDVTAASEAFGTELRIHLIRYFAQHPGARQVDAVRALGVDRAVVSSNAHVLTDIGVLHAAGDRTYSVDLARCRRLQAAVDSFIASA